MFTDIFSWRLVYLILTVLAGLDTGEMLGKILFKSHIISIISSHAKIGMMMLKHTPVFSLSCLSCYTFTSSLLSTEVYCITSFVFGGGKGR